VQLLVVAVLPRLGVRRLGRVEDLGGPRRLASPLRLIPAQGGRVVHPLGARAPRSSTDLIVAAGTRAGHERGDDRNG
jgi:hypothetical protein